MYIPKFYEITDWPEIERFIRETSLATLVSIGEEFPVATHLPLDLATSGDGVSTLSGHVAKSNPHWRLFESRPEAVAIFLSPVNHYISSSWYDHPNVPTWNYMSVQVYGRIKIVDESRLRISLRKMTQYHEKISSRPLTQEILETEIDKQIGGIIGFEMSIEKIEAAYKMSQNRDAGNYRRIIDELNRLDDYNAKIVAKRMSEIRKVD